MHETTWPLKPHTHIISLSDDHVLISWLGQRILLKTPVARDIPEIFETLKNPVNATQLKSSVGPHWLQKDVEDFLQHLHTHRLVFTSNTQVIARADTNRTDSIW